jgi:hypothetical protein
LLGGEAGDAVRVECVLEGGRGKRFRTRAH